MTVVPTAVALGALVLGLAAPTARAAAGYATEGKCAGLPRLALKVPPGWARSSSSSASPA